MKTHNILIILLVIFWTCIIIISIDKISNNYIYEAEELPSRIGQILESNDASEQSHRFSSYNESGLMVFGPYVKMPKGNYLVSFRLKTDTKNDLAPISNLEIFSFGVGKINETKIYAKDFKDLKSYQLFNLTFKSEEKKNYEFRIYKYKGVNLYADEIIISKQDKYLLYKPVITNMIKTIIFLCWILLTILFIRELKMKAELSKLLLIFITFIYILTLPVGLYSTDEITHIFVAQNLIDHGSLYLDDIPEWFFSSYTLRTNGDHYYSQYPPGLAILISPFLLVSKYFNIGTEVSLLRPDEFSQIISIMLSKMVSIISSILTILLIYKICRLLNLQEKTSLIVMITYSFGTIAWIYSGTLYTHSVSTFLNLTSVYFLIVFMTVSGYKNLVISGFFIAVSFWLRLDAILTLIPILLLVLIYIQTKKISISQKIKYVMAISLPIFIVISTFLLYNVYITRGFQTSYGNIITVLLTYPNIRSFFDMFIGLHAGLFIFNPILIFWLFTYPYFFTKKKFSLEYYLILAIPLFYILFYLFWKAWDGGWSWGPRHLHEALPYMSIMVGFTYEKIIKENKILNIFFVMILGTSIIINLIGTLTDFNIWYESLAQGKITPDTSPILFNLKLILNGKIDNVWLYVMNNI